MQIENTIERWSPKPIHINGAQTIDLYGPPRRPITPALVLFFGRSTTQQLLYELLIYELGLFKKQ